MSAYKILFCCLLITINSRAQKLMQLPDSVKSALEQFDIKLKSGIDYFRYEIGPYHLENIRRSWKTSSTTRGTGASFVSRLFSRSEETEIKEKSAFAFISKSTDTAYVHVSTTTTLRYVDYSRGLFGNSKREKELESGVSNYVTLIQTNRDSGEWSLAAFAAISQPEIIKVGAEAFEAWLTDGMRKISLTPIYKYEDGKAHISGEMLGCLFEENGRVLGAIQFLGPVLISLQKQNHLWLRKDLDDSTKFILATAATALMARVHQLR